MHSTTKRGRRHLATFLAGAVALALAACSSGSPASERDESSVPGALEALSVAIGADPVNLDPRLTWVGQGYSINAHIYEPLVERTDDGEGNVEITGLLAETWENRDDTTWVFHLREGVTFHNGEPFTAEAAKFTIESIMDPDLATPLKVWTSTIESVEAEDDLTLVIRTVAPARGLLNSLVQVPIVSPQAVEEFGEEFTLNPTGTGPYQFVSYTPNNQVVIEQYPEYWGDQTGPETIDWRVMPESSARIAAIQAGEVQIAENIPPDQLPTLESNSDIEVATASTMRVIMMVPLLTNEWMQNPDFRRGLSLAIDRESIVEDLLGGTTEPANSVSPPGTVGHNDDLQPYPYDLDEAAALIEASGYDGSVIRVGAPQGRYQMDAQAGEAVAGMLEQAGVNVEFTALPWSEYSGQTAKGTDAFDFYFLGTTDFTLYPTSFYNGLFGCELGRNYYCDEDLSAKIDATAAMLDDDEAAAAYAEIQEIVYEDLPVVPLYWEPAITAVSQGLTGFHLRMDEYIVTTEVGSAEQ
ncbi:ABC transporter substrate-binding protein [Georgenia faecalis]|uniref:ABC transporter substrate-binding protein n=1 Tax=Georgenia faecalis TaxID=2483799 RepID=A0ABV9DBG7_9MICO|nr:ABC transporter substrate-binding protein [Georgenia faecalis]